MRLLMLALAAGAIPAFAGMAIDGITEYIVTAPPDANAAKYLATEPFYDGVALLSMTWPQGAGTCTAALLPGGWDLLTAAHCFYYSGALAASASATFYTGGSSMAYTAAKLTPHPLWNGDLGGGNDIALVRLDRAVAASIPRYPLFTGSADLGSVYEVVGYGRSGIGTTGATLAAGTQRRGFNTWDATIAGGAVLLSDFDSGLPAQDALGLVFGIPHEGLGEWEVSTAKGDSGGPSFVDGRIAGVTSFGATPGAPIDADNVTNSSYGEYNGMTRVSWYTNWVYSQIVPEPSTWAFAALGMGLLAIARRR